MMAQITIKLTTDEKRKLEHLAAERCRTTNRQARYILKTYLADYEPVIIEPLLYLNDRPIYKDSVEIKDLSIGELKAYLQAIDECDIIQST